MDLVQPGIGSLGAPSDVNITQVGGNAVTTTLPVNDPGLPDTLGQKASSGSTSVVIASDQTVPISAVSLPLPIGAANDTLQTTGNAYLANIAASTVLPDTLVAFVTTVSTAGTRVQLAVHTIEAGILQAPSTNTGVIYVGGPTVSSTVYGAELQAGQATGIALDDTSDIWIDASVSGDKCAFFGSD